MPPRSVVAARARQSSVSASASVKTMRSSASAGIGRDVERQDIAALHREFVDQALGQRSAALAARRLRQQRSRPHRRRLARPRPAARRRTPAGAPACRRATATRIMPASALSSGASTGGRSRMSWHLAFDRLDRGLGSGDRLPRRCPHPRGSRRARRRTHRARRAGRVRLRSAARVRPEAGPGLRSRSWLA